MILFCDDVSELTEGSSREVLVYCDGCESYRPKRFYAALESKTNLCKACSFLYTSKVKYIGRTFSRLTILDIVQSDSRNLYAKCSCDCGSIKEIQLRAIKDGTTKSCGCLSAELSRERMLGKSGSRHPSWNPDKSRRAKEIRESFDYAKFRQAVMDRDCYECKKCGIDIDLEVHHILNFKDHEEMACEVDNGIVLCKSCHIKYHLWNGGFKAKTTREGLMEWLNDD